MILVTDLLVQMNLPNHNRVWLCSCTGFCIINNAYLLARNLIDKEKARKVLIFDWDLHHGNGTEK